jgi:hypothetical protein
VDRSGLVRELNSDTKLNANFKRLRSVATPETEALAGRLAEKRFVENPGLLRSVLVRASGTGDEPPTPQDVVAKMSPLADREFGTGIAKLKKANAELGKTLDSVEIGNTGVLVEVDQIARQIPAEKMSEFIDALSAELKLERNPGTLLKALSTLRTRFTKS